MALTQAPGTRAESVARAVADVEANLERFGQYYPADLPAHHHARRAGWRIGLRWTDDGFVRCYPSEFASLRPLQRALETERCHATALLVSERLNEVILTQQQREELGQRALGILPDSEAARYHELFSCPPLLPRRICRSARELVAGVGAIEEEMGRATAIGFGMLTLAGLRHEHELVKYGERIDRLFARVVAAPDVIQALNVEVPADDPAASASAQVNLLVTVREALWQLLPGRVSTEFLLTQVIDAYIGEKPGGGNSLGLALVDSIIIARLGFAVSYRISDGVLSLRVKAADQLLHWNVIRREPLSAAPDARARELNLTDLFAVAYGSLATLCFTRSMWDRALDCYNRQLELTPGSAETLTSLAACYLRKQSPTDAIKMCKAALEIAPDSAETLHQLGNAHAMTNSWPKAIDSYKKALRVRPEYAEVYNNLGFAYMRSEMPDQAVAAFETAIEKRPDYFQAHYNLGNLHLERGEHDRAIGYYRDAVRLEPKFVGAFYNLGRAYYEKQDLDGAIHSYQKAVQLNPKHFGAWHNLGIAYRDKGLTDKAVAALEKAVSINPNLMR
jgi:tetratricopeptide (TPR) repeat protein